jgi:hypothetical protein
MTCTSVKKQKLIDLVGSALLSDGSKLWSEILSHTRHDVALTLTSLADIKALRLLRSLLFAKLKSLFPDLHSASLICRQNNSSVAAADDVIDLATAMVDEEFLPSLSRCLKIDASILGCVIELRRRLHDLEVKFNVLTYGTCNSSSSGKSPTASAVGPPASDVGNPAQASTGNTLLSYIAPVVLASGVTSPGVANNGNPSAIPVTVASCAMPPAAADLNASNASPMSDDPAPFISVNRRGKKTGAVFFYNLQDSYTTDMLTQALVSADIHPTNVRRFTTTRGYCSFRASVPRASADLLVFRERHVDLPAGCRTRLWENRPPGRGLDPASGAVPAAQVASTPREASAPQRAPTPENESFLDMITHCIDRWTRAQAQHRHV